MFRIAAYSPEKACAVYLGPSCGSSIDPFNQNWSIPIPGNKPPVMPVPLPEVGAAVCPWRVYANYAYLCFVFSVLLTVLVACTLAHAKKYNCVCQRQPDPSIHTQGDYAKSNIVSLVPRGSGSKINIRVC